MRLKISILSVILISFSAIAGENKDLVLYNTILAQDKAFFNAFNNCNFEEWKKYLSEDIEFYQDNDKVTTTRKQLEPAFAGRCGKGNLWKLRRELIPETVEVHPIQDFGALQIGTHRFFLIEHGKPDKLEATPKFIHLWRYKDGQWQITRVISYSH